MKVCELRDDFGFSNLTLTERPDPEPGEDEVVIELEAASPNFRDLMTIKGLYNPDLDLPMIPFSDGVGRVVARGEGVRRVEEGDRVAPNFAPDWIEGPLTAEKRASSLGGIRDGTLRERMAVPARSVVRVPDHLSAAQAATLPCAGVTAWNALTKYRRVRSGDVVLLQGTGGVSIFALQFARVLGAEIIQTSSSDEKLTRVEEMGAHHTINYEDEPDWDEAVLEITDGEGVDMVVEVGGSGTLQKSMNAAAFGGQISVIGVLSGGQGDLSILPTLMKTLDLQGIYVGSRRDFEAMNRAVETNEIVPVVDREFPLEEIQEALEYQEQGRHFGKLAIAL